MAKQKGLRHPSKRIADWRWRWVVLPGWRRLHRVSLLDLNQFRNDKRIPAQGGKGVTVCGRKGLLIMPGILSRIGLPRCHHCCRITHVPDGLGNPYNNSKTQGVAAR